MDMRQVSTPVKTEEAEVEHLVAATSDEIIAPLSMPYIAITASSAGMLPPALVNSVSMVPAPTTTLPVASSNGSIPGVYHRVAAGGMAEVAAKSNSVSGHIPGQANGTANTVPYQNVVSVADNGTTRNDHRHSNDILIVRSESALGQARTNISTPVTLSVDSTSESSFGSSLQETLVKGNGVPHQRCGMQAADIDGIVADSDNAPSEATPGSSRQESVEHSMPLGAMIRSSNTDTVLPKGGVPTTALSKNPDVSFLENVRVAGVEVVESYSECITCTNRVIPDQNDPELGSCIQCNMMQRMDDTNVVLGASLVVKVGEREFLPLRAFGEVVEFISQKPAEEVSMKTLLKAEPFSLSHRDGIIISATRCGSTTKSAGLTVSLCTS
jgi:hypothetical protein